MKKFIDAMIGFSSVLPSKFMELFQEAMEYARGLEVENQRLRDEIARLKNVPEKPIINPGKSKNDEKKGEPRSGVGGKVGGSKKGQGRQKKKDLEIHETIVIKPQSIPPGAKLLDEQEYIVQDIEIRNKNTRFCIQRWVWPDGTVIRGDLPIELVGHYGAELRRFVLYQFHHNRVTEPLLLEELHELGILISSGQLHKILVEGHELFHQEKQDILTAGLSSSTYIQVDDTGSRHNGQNGFTTVICNNLFTVFASTESKSRVNFLEALQGDQVKYRITRESLEYMERYHLPPFQLKKFRLGLSFSTETHWTEYLNQIDVVSSLHIRLATEAALLGALLVTDINPNLIVLSDDAGQFNILRHALCWFHAERLIKKLEPINDIFANELNKAREDIWDFYDKLTDFKEHPDPEKIQVLISIFDELFQRDYQFTSLKLAMRRLYENKDELLMVLKTPAIPLHNNQSESDVREKVVRRKISVTFNDESLRSRDTFASLKKTCRKMKIKFWTYLGDRLNGKFQIPNLGTLVRSTSLA